MNRIGLPQDLEFFALGTDALKEYGRPFEHMTGLRKALRFSTVSDVAFTASGGCLVIVQRVFAEGELSYPVFLGRSEIKTL